MSVHSPASLAKESRQSHRTSRGGQSHLETGVELHGSCLPLSVYASVCVCVCVCVCMHRSVCLPLTIFKSVSEPSCISGSVSLETGPPFPSSGPGLSLVLILTLADELALAGCLIWHGCV